MNFRVLIIVPLLVFLAVRPGASQDKLNSTDSKGMKQGRWIKKYPTGIVMYDGYFRNDHPAGEFKRFYETGAIRSVLVYSEDGRDAEAILYYPDGKLASKGHYRDQKKEGKWQFYAPGDGNLIIEEVYAGDLRNGLSIKYFSDGAIAEEVNWSKGVKNGEWKQYYPDGSNRVKSGYANGKLHGKFDVWYDNGKKEFSGQYANDSRDGTWVMYNKDGSLKYKIEYRNGVTNNKQMDIDASDYLDSLEKNKDKIADPEKSGDIR